MTLEIGNFLGSFIGNKDFPIGAICSGPMLLAVTMAHLLGFECPERIFSGYMDSWTPDDYEQYLPLEEVEEIKSMLCDS